MKKINLIIVISILASSHGFSQILEAGKAAWKTGGTSYTIIKDLQGMATLETADFTDVPIGWTTENPTDGHLNIDSRAFNEPNIHEIEIAYNYPVDLSNGGPFAYHCEQYYVRDSSETILMLSLDSIDWHHIPLNQDVPQKGEKYKLKPVKIPAKFYQQKVWVKLKMIIINMESNNPPVARWIVDDVAFVQLPVIRIITSDGNPLQKKVELCDGDSLVVKPHFVNPPGDNSINVNYNWDGNAISGSISDTVIVIKNEGNIQLKGASNFTGANAYSSDNEMDADNDTIEVEVQRPYDEKIFLVTVDTATNRNLIVWKRTTDKATEKYMVYKTILNGRKELGSIPFADVPVFIDTTSRPWLRPEKYIITTIDTCGNEALYAVADAHQTMKLNVDPLIDGSIKLTWNPYVGFDYGEYFVYRGETPGNMELLTSLTADPNSGLATYTDMNPLPGDNYYRVEVDKGEVLDYSKKANSGPFSRSLSNLEDNRQQGTNLDLENSSGLVLYPNPVSGNLRLQFTNLDNAYIHVQLMNIQGQLVQDIASGTGDINATFDTRKLARGIYLVNIRKNGLLQETKKLVVQ